MTVENKKEIQTVYFDKKQIFRYIDKLRDLIWNNDAHEIEVPGQGATWISNVIGLKINEDIEVGWSRWRDEDGSLIWGSHEGLRSGEYCVMYVDPYNETLHVIKVKESGKKPVAIELGDLNKLFSLREKVMNSKR